MNIDLRQAAKEGNEEVLQKINILGLDYSQEHFYVDSEGRKANYPHYYLISEDKLAREQRKLSHMVKDSSNYKTEPVGTPGIDPLSCQAITGIAG